MNEWRRGRAWQPTLSDIKPLKSLNTKTNWFRIPRSEPISQQNVSRSVLSGIALAKIQQRSYSSRQGGALPTCMTAMNDNGPFAKKLISDAVKQTESRIVDVNAIVRAIHEQYPQASKQEIMGVVLKIIQHSGLTARWE